jgi:hypothetical protein
VRVVRVQVAVRIARGSFVVFIKNSIRVLCDITNSLTLVCFADSGRKWFIYPDSKKSYKKKNRFSAIKADATLAWTCWNVYYLRCPWNVYGTCRNIPESFFTFQNVDGKLTFSVQGSMHNWFYFSDQILLLFSIHLIDILIVYEDYGLFYFSEFVTSTSFQCDDLFGIIYFKLSTKKLNS